MYGARGTRTPDLLGAIQALSQLSYSPTHHGVVEKCSGTERCRTADEGTVSSSSATRSCRRPIEGSR
jgi:hypothetical protein